MLCTSAQSSGAVLYAGLTKYTRIADGLHSFASRCSEFQKRLSLSLNPRCGEEAGVLAATFVSSILHFSEAADAVGKAGSRMKPAAFRRMVASRAAYQLLEQVAGADAVRQMHESGEGLAGVVTGE